MPTINVIVMIREGLQSVLNEYNTNLSVSSLCVLYIPCAVSRVDVITAGVMVVVCCFSLFKLHIKF